MFHKVMWQHIKRMVRVLIYHLTANLPENLSVKKKLQIGLDLADCTDCTDVGKLYTFCQLFNRVSPL